MWHEVDGCICKDTVPQRSYSGATAFLRAQDMLVMEQDCLQASPQEALAVHEPHLPLPGPGWAHLSSCSQEKRGKAKSPC